MPHVTNVNRDGEYKLCFLKILVKLSNWYVRDWVTDVSLIRCKINKKICLILLANADTPYCWHQKRLIFLWIHNHHSGQVMVCTDVVWQLNWLYYTWKAIRCKRVGMTSISLIRTSLLQDLMWRHCHLLIHFVTDVSEFWFILMTISFLSVWKVQPDFMIDSDLCNKLQMCFNIHLIACRKYSTPCSYNLNASS